MKERTLSHRISCGRKREGNGSFSQPPRVSSHFNVAILNSGLAFKKTNVLRVLQTEISNTPPNLQMNILSLPYRRRRLFLKTLYKNTFLVRTHRLNLSKKMLCVVALPTDQPCRDRDYGKGLMIRASQYCPCSACPLIHDVPDGPVGFTKSTSAQHRRRVTVDPALALLF